MWGEDGQRWSSCRGLAALMVWGGGTGGEPWNFNEVILLYCLLCGPKLHPNATLELYLRSIQGEKPWQTLAWACRLGVYGVRQMAHVPTRYITLCNIYPLMTALSQIIQSGWSLGLWGRKAKAPDWLMNSNGGNLKPSRIFSNIC